METWEYLTVHVISRSDGTYVVSVDEKSTAKGITRTVPRLSEWLVNAGEEGWELITSLQGPLSPANSEVTLIFKRELE